ncbi:2OG-Fe(II) oxygenase [Amycolatopsis sp. WAC 04169]|uniref:2OG-Fe(II) oxygenase n=1 Tax=Amycolatopsis sp. WAC 04169 TaxID=2203197 RepID=UPI0013156466|nr:2OG-Fe(II) oxygenase [Amycolatopsis sp. WAC 04169]
MVIDEFLDAETLGELRKLMVRSTFSEVESVIYPDTDGKACRSKGAVFEGTIDVDRVTGRPKAYEKIRKSVAAEPAMFGPMGDGWDRIGFTFWQYPPGSRLSWHNDSGGGRKGEFILFLHDSWNASWGGELMILDEDPVQSNEGGGGDFIARMENRVRQSPTNPTAIIPLPNRLVLVKAGTVHQINRVDPTAARQRCTLTGFVSKKPHQSSSEARSALLGLATDATGSRI